MDMVASEVTGLWSHVAGIIRSVRGRPYAPRLDLQVQAEVVGDLNAPVLVARLTARNIGQIPIRLDHRATLLELQKAPVLQQLDEVEMPEWDHVASYPAFCRHGWIESGEQINEEMSVAFPCEGRYWYRAIVNFETNKYRWSTIVYIRQDRLTPCQSEAAHDL